MTDCDIFLESYKSLNLKPRMRHKNTIKFFGLWQGYPSGRFSRRFAPQNDRVLRTEHNKRLFAEK